MIDTTLVGSTSVGSVVPSVIDAASSSMKSGLPPDVVQTLEDGGRHGVLLEQTARQLVGSGLVERVEGERRIRREAAPEAWPGVEELRARRRHEQHRNLGHPSGEVLDEVEQGCLRPVQVFQAQDSRFLATECLDEAARRVEQDRAIRELAGPEARHDRERLGRAVGVRAGERSRTGAELLASVLGPVGLEDARGLAHDLRERPVSRALSVGQRPPA
jgi:hypothetical protein